MIDETVRKALAQSNWASMCRHLQSHAQMMSMDCPGEPANLMAEVSSRFCDQVAPEAEEETRIRIRQSAALSSIIFAIAQGHSRRRHHPAIMSEILGEMKKLCEQPLPRTDEEFSDLHSQCTVFSIRVNSISDDDAKRQL